MLSVRIALMLCVLGCPLLLAGRPLVGEADGPSVVINELLWMGSSVSSADEWLELRNTTDTAIDLSNWQVTKKSGGAEMPMLTIPNGKSIPAQGYFLISNYTNGSASSTLNVVPDYVTTDVALSNSALQIKLYDASHQLIDTADDGVGNPLAGAYDSSKKVYASMERNPVPGDGSLAQNWHTASRAVGFKSGGVELGTPGSLNSNGLPVANAGPDLTGVVGQAVNFDGSDSSDPENQPLAYNWDFGDGSISNEPTPSHIFNTAGQYAVSLSVSDGTDAAIDHAQVTIQNAPTMVPPIPPAPAPTISSTPPSMNSCRGLVLSELYPNPPGVDNDEYIELVNRGDEEVSPASCAVFTTATRNYKLTGTTEIPVGGYLLLPKTLTHLTLNNGGATVRLVDADGTALDQTTYAMAGEGKTWALLNDGTWQWTAKPTPGAANVAVASPATTAAAPKKSTGPAAKPKTTAAVKPAQAVTIPEIQELDSGDRVVIRGVVTVPVGALGATMTNIQSAAGGVTISIPSGEPPIKVGQEIELTGTVHLKQGRRQVSVATHGMTLLNLAAPPEPVTLATDDVSQEQADQLVHVKGVVSLASGNSITIDDGSGPIPVYIKSSTGIVRPKVKMGDTLEATGIVNVATTGIRVLPRSQDDLHVQKVLGAATTAATNTTVVPPSSSAQTVWYWVFAGVGAALVAARPAWRAWRKKKAA